LLQFDHFDFFSQNTPSHTLFFKKKNPKKKKKTKNKYAPITYLCIVNLLFLVFWFLYFFKKIKYVIGHFGGKKKVKMVELQQFKSLGG
jgi:hypothetical protein